MMTVRDVRDPRMTDFYSFEKLILLSDGTPSDPWSSLGSSSHYRAPQHSNLVYLSLVENWSFSYRRSSRLRLLPIR